MNWRTANKRARRKRARHLAPPLALALKFLRDAGIPNKKINQDMVRFVDAAMTGFVKAAELSGTVFSPETSNPKT
jgi:hypothetical protein